MIIERSLEGSCEVTFFCDKNKTMFPIRFYINIKENKSRQQTVGLKPTSDFQTSMPSIILQMPALKSSILGK